MIIPIETILFWGSMLIFLSVLASKLADKFALPALLLFIAIGMLAGSEGPGRIYFDDPSLAKTIGIVALVFIIFSGGLNTVWEDIRPVLPQGIVLSTVGVLVTALVAGSCAVFILKFSFFEGLLLGAIISSTDAAAVFSVLKSKRISLKNPLKPLLEFESGSNDPMAVFLTVGIIQILTGRINSLTGLFPVFLLDMGMGAILGYCMARLSVWIINHLKLDIVDLYPVLTISLVLLTYSITAFFKGNGFLAVYIVGLVMSKKYLIHKKTILRFHESLAWIMQIVMFLALGLLVFPSQITPVMGTGLLVAVALMFFARPLSVFICLWPFRIPVKDKAMIAWVGLRGAVPVILATFPLLAGVGQARNIFNIVFFVVLTSVLIQGTSISFISRRLGVDVPVNRRMRNPLAMEESESVDAELTDVMIPYNSVIIGKPVYEIGVPERCLIVLISRDDKFIIPNGSSVILEGDVLQVLASREDIAAFRKKIEKICSTA